MSDLVQTRDQKIQQLEQRLDQSQAVATQAQTKADTAAAQSAEEQQTVMALKGDVTDLKTGATSTALTLQETQKKNRSDWRARSPSTSRESRSLRAAFWRQNRCTALARSGSDINTPFNGLNMPGSGQNAISEFFGSGRQSRVSMLAEGKFNDTKLTGYVRS